MVPVWYRAYRSYNGHPKEAAGNIKGGRAITRAAAVRIAERLARLYPKHAFIKGNPIRGEYDRVIKGLGFGEAEGEMTDESCRLCKDPGKPMKVMSIYDANEKWGKEK